MCNCDMFTQFYEEYWLEIVVNRDGVSTIQMYSSTITLNMHEYEYEYSENKCTRVRVQLLYNILERFILISLWRNVSHIVQYNRSD